MGLRQLLRATAARVVGQLPASVQRDLALLRGERWRIRRDPSYLVERRDWQEFFRRAFTALKFNGIDGDYAEFGCAGGRTFSLAYHESRRIGWDGKLWAFDSFQGLPAQQGPEDSHPAWVEGTMRTDLERFQRLVKSHGVPRSAYEVVAGYYEETLAGDVSRPPTNVAIAYIDCDLYSSTMTVLRFLLPRLKHGMI
ncbi:MAG: TylF/MycF/NovP-related O-methyltransferase, partial [Candidatus Binatia bacterium]